MPWFSLKSVTEKFCFAGIKWSWTSKTTIQELTVYGDVQRRITFASNVLSMCILWFQCQTHWRSLFGHKLISPLATRCYDNLMAVLMKKLHRYDATVHWKQKPRRLINCVWLSLICTADTSRNKCNIEGVNRLMAEAPVWGSHFHFCLDGGRIEEFSSVICHYKYQTIIITL